MKKEEVIVQLQVLQEQVKYLRNQIQQCETQQEELTKTYDALDQLRDVKEGTEIKVPLAGGIFISATLNKVDPVLVNVGANVSVKKSIDDTHALIKEQQKELEGLKKQLMTEHDKMIDHFNELKTKV